MRWKSPEFLQRLLFSGSREKGVLWAAQSLACLCAAWVIATVFWWMATPDSAAVREKQSPALIEQKQRVVARHFFDVEPVSSPVLDKGTQNQAAAPDTRWRLQGTYVGAPSRAILAAEGRVEVAVVKVGDQLSSGHEVVEVLPDSIVLSKEGQRSELVLRPLAPEPPGNNLPDNRFGNSGTPPINKDSR
ncbi:MAG: hypothetical protein EON54_22445 [Alcaligenaceae bacterium]|nr:MAG: hypothetical protein EON54_22445 [Alcaligenaceae bacterium]